jgi:hypothetical protein
MDFIIPVDGNGRKITDNPSTVDGDRTPGCRGRTGGVFQVVGRPVVIGDMRRICRIDGKGRGKYVGGIIDRLE